MFIAVFGQIGDAINQLGIRRQCARLTIGMLEAVLPAKGREFAEPAVSGGHRKAVRGNAVIRVASNGAIPATQRPQERSPSRAVLYGA